MKPTLIPSVNFNQTVEGGFCNLYTLKNKNGLIAEITNYGGRVVSLWTPDRNGNFEDIVLGFDTVEEYVQRPTNCYGATIGRYANRINKAAFKLDEQTYQLRKNEDENQLHGGVHGFHNVVWDVIRQDDQVFELSYVSKDGEEGYPGNMTVRLRYTLTSQNDLLIEYSATTDRACPINLTHHSFFNLLGAGQADVLNHELEINANHFVPVNTHKIPTGNIISVESTPMDFRRSKRIGADIEKPFDQLLLVGGGYDHSFELDKSSQLDFAARVCELKYGRTLEVFTNEPAVQFYSMNAPGTTIGKSGKTYGRYGAFCLETQHHPDSPNQPNFPSTILQVGQKFESYCRYHFGVTA